MKFGKLENVDHVNFDLPSQPLGEGHFMSEEIITSNRSVLYTGATSWNNTAWKGTLYGKEVKTKAFLYHYSRQFNSIEMNGTHYRTPSDKTIEKWKDETPTDFRFCPKILQAISHRNDMLQNKNLVNEFIVQLSKLEEKLGQTFIQLPPYFKSTSFRYLNAFLKVWPEDMSLAVELRSFEIHNDPAVFQEYLDILMKYNCTPVITDVAGRRDLLHMSVTCPNVFVRFVGNGLHASDYSRIKQWKNYLADWTRRGVENTYFMLHEPENEKTPELAAYLNTEFKNIQYIEHRGPKLVADQPNLFSQI